MEGSGAAADGGDEEEEDAEEEDDDDEDEDDDAMQFCLCPVRQCDFWQDCEQYQT